MPDDITLIREKERAARPETGLRDKVIVIGDSAMATGFKLAGVSEVYVAEGDSAKQKVIELLDRENAGILVINESILASLDHRTQRRIEAIAKPVVVAVPDKFGSSPQTESLRDMIKRALGFELAK